MAEKATRLPTLQPAPGATVSDADRAEIEQLSAAAAKSNKKKAEAAAKKSNVPDEVYVRNWDAISAAIAVRKDIEKQLKQAKAVESSCYSTAKNDGCNIEAMKMLRKLEKIDIDELDADMKVVARIAGLVESPVAETSFMKLLDDADKVNHYTQGFTAGKAGDDLANCPHKAGSVEFEKYEKGWRDGQAKLAQELFKPGKASKKAKQTTETVN